MNQDRLPAEPKWMLQLLLDTIPVRVFWKDRNSVYLGCNRLFAADAGFSSVEDVVGKTDRDMPWRDRADMYQADDRTVMQTGTPKLDYEEPLTMADGRTVWLRISKVPLKDERGQIIGVMAASMDITERRNAAEQIRERESLYRTMFEQSPFSVALTTVYAKFVDVNKKFVEITGVPREEAIGHTSAELGIMDQNTEIALVNTIRNTGKIDGQEIRARTRKGETKHALVSSALVKLGDETLVLSILNDITERKQAEDALRASKEKYKELVQEANSIILRWGRDGTVYFFNEFAQSFFGFTEEEIVGRGVLGTIVPETETSGRDLQELMAEITAHPEFHRTNVNENMRKNGERVWIAWTNKPVFNDQGEMTEILSVGLDITDRISNQQALQESEARYRSIFNSNVDAFLLFDTDGIVVDANARAGELYGYPRNELIGLRGKEIVDPQSYHLFEDFMNTALGEWLSREFVDVRKDGSRFDVELHGTRLRYGGSERLLAVVFDVTERNRARQSMRLFNDVVQNMQLGLYIYHLDDESDDRTLRLTAANPASTEDLGLSGNEMIGKYIDEVFPNLREQGIPERFADVVRTGVPFTIAEFSYSDARVSPKHFSFRVFALPENQVGVMFEDISEQVQARDERRRFYRKTIEAATGGKLLICDREEIERLAGPPVATVEVICAQDLAEARHIVREVAASEGMDESRVSDLILCVGEATTNAIKHADGGQVSVHKINSALFVRVTDRGPGIQAINLPDVALKRGYTTAISLGMGYKAMLSVSDRVYLATGPGGTTVAVEMSLHAPTKLPPAAGFLDTW